MSAAEHAEWKVIDLSHWREYQRALPELPEEAPRERRMGG
jgi:hypothetical protein